MKKMIKVGIVLAALLSASCKSDTEYGECVGMLEERDPRLTYEPSVHNIVLAVVFVETIFVPVLVVLEEHSCPTGRKQP
jgi:hypothetical protein